jgi:hypothetical protein
MWAVGSICTAAGFVDTIFCIDDNRDACRQEVVNFSSNVDKSVDKQEEAALALLLNLSDNYHKQAQINTVFTTQETWTGWWDLNPRPPTFQEMPNFFIFVGIIHIIIGLKFELVSRLSNHGFSYFVFE